MQLTVTPLHPEWGSVVGRKVQKENFDPKTAFISVSQKQLLEQVFIDGSNMESEARLRQSSLYNCLIARQNLRPKSTLSTPL